MNNIHEDRVPLTQHSSDSDYETDVDGPVVTREDEFTTYFVNEKVSVPDDGTKSFSWKKLWAFTGPGFLMSIAYLDPGNIESDLQAGAAANYKLLWVLLFSTFMGLLLQRLSARLGVITGKHLAEVCYDEYPRTPRLSLWIMVEVAIIGSDMQEVIGTAIAYQLLSNGAIPLWAGTLITVCDTFIFLFLDKYGLRKLEAFFGFLILVMAITFGAEFGIAQPNGSKLLQGLVIPWCAGCGSFVIKQAVGIVGAIIMPHNLYLHSALVRSRDVDRKNPSKVKEANFYFFTEATIALSASFLVNLFVVSVFAEGYYPKTVLIDDCKAATWNTIGKGNTSSIDLHSAGIFLNNCYGKYAGYIWGIGLLAAGQSSTMTGTYSGQFVMEGFLLLKWPRWMRVLVTRLIAIGPTLSLAIISGANFSGWNEMLNVLQSLQLPFALIPILTFAGSARIMGQYAMGRLSCVTLWSLAVLVMGINTYFVIIYIQKIPRVWYAYVILVCLGTFYISLILYLVTKALGFTKTTQLEQQTEIEMEPCSN